MKWWSKIVIMPPVGGYSQKVTLEIRRFFSHFEANAKTFRLPAYLTVNGILKKEVYTCIYNKRLKVKV